MGISAWWADDSRQRFWVEVTDREDLGADLAAPQTDEQGEPYWGYELLNYVKPGDVVYHWHRKLAGEPAFVGWSRACATAAEREISWKSHRTVTSATKTSDLRPGWCLPLEGYRPLEPVIRRSDVGRRSVELRAIHTLLSAQHKGASLYFPFQLRSGGEVRASQTYLAKMPAEVVEVLGLPQNHPPRLAAPMVLPGDEDKRRRHRGIQGAGYVADPIVRTAIERHAVGMAVALYETRGYAVIDTGATQPYDLEVTSGSEVRRVEVKGTTSSVDSVELTHGEVRNSREFEANDLVVVDGIVWQRGSDGEVETSGGNLRWWSDWTADDAALAPTRYRYSLPEGGSLR